ncbi:MAG: hypothetical protein ACREEM_21975 [Blastocatellia bacterium]
MKSLSARLISARHLAFAFCLIIITLLAAETGARWRAAGQGGNTVTVVSAASFEPGPVAPEAIVSAFGSQLATRVETAGASPLPTQLAGTTVRIRDSAGVERLAPLFFVAPQQINCLIPANTASGAATITVTSGNGAVSTGALRIAGVAPGLFTANANGQGVAAAVVQRRNAAGQDSFEPAAVFDLATNRFVARPIDLGPETDQVFLLLFGTGFRFRGALSTVTARIGGTDAQVTFAGAQGVFAGLDQCNVRLLRSLAGRGDMEIVLTVDGKAANMVRVTTR